MCKLRVANIYILEVPLGVVPLNENKLPEMCAIMSTLQKYVPQNRATRTTTVGNDVITCEKTEVCPILLGGDQLTAARARGAKSPRATHDTSFDRLEGFIPIAEDWHARLNLAKVRYLENKKRHEQ